MMDIQRLPKIDSIRELANFWDKHDVTDFEDELEEVQEPVFAQSTVISLDLEFAEASAVRNIAKDKGVPATELIRGWVREKISSRQ